MNLLRKRLSTKHSASNLDFLRLENEPDTICVHAVPPYEEFVQETNSSCFETYKRVDSSIITVILFQFELLLCNGNRLIS